MELEEVLEDNPETFMRSRTFSSQISAGPRKGREEQISSLTVRYYKISNISPSTVPSCLIVKKLRKS